MTTFRIEHELPPLRAIYNVWCDVDDEEEAREIFKRERPQYRIRKVVVDLNDPTSPEKL